MPNLPNLTEAEQEIERFHSCGPSVTHELLTTISDLRGENERMRSAMEQIASCDSHIKGDVVDIARAALQGMLDHSCVADSCAEDKEPEDHAAESEARRVIAQLKADYASQLLDVKEALRQRDAERAEAGRLREALRNACDALHNDFEPDNQMRQWHAARAALAGEGKGNA